MQKSFEVHITVRQPNGVHTYPQITTFNTLEAALSAAEEAFRASAECEPDDMRDE